MHILTVRGLNTAHCAGTVSTAIRSLDPCAQVAVDLASGIVRSDSALSDTQITAAIEAAGFRPSFGRNPERDVA